MDVKPAVLLEGTWYALEQCGILLRDATVLYKSNAHSSAVALAMIGREELGKSRMLLEEWKKSQDTGTLPKVEVIKAACEDHIEKQKLALLGLTFMADAGTAIDEALRIIMRNNPQDAEYQDAEKFVQMALKRLAKQAPEARHTARMRALYVDLNDSGIGWDRPMQISQAESAKLLNAAANDYAGQRDRLQPERLRALGDMKLAEVLEAWANRPDLPEPVWVDLDGG